MPPTPETAYTPDRQIVELGPDGRFEFPGLPAGKFAVSVPVPGYRLSARNKSLNRRSPHSMVGRIDRDVVNLTILLEPGQDLRPDFDFYDETPKSEWPESRPFEGVVEK